MDIKIGVSELGMVPNLGRIKQEEPELQKS